MFRSKRLTQYLRREKPAGFTIIEVIIVLTIATLIILAIFLAAGPARRAQRDDARKNAALRLVPELADYYQQHNSSYVGFSCTSYCQSINDPDSITGHPVAGSPGVSATSTSGVTYVIGGVCGTGTDAGKALSSSFGAGSYAILYWLEDSETSHCTDNQGNIVASASAPDSPSGGGSGGGSGNDSSSVSSWSGQGGVYSSCLPSADKCLSYKGGAAYTAWSPTQFVYSMSDVSSGTKTLEIQYQNSTPLPSSYPYFNVNIYINGTKVLANQQLPVNTDGSAPGPFVINVSSADTIDSVGVEWTNDWCCSDDGGVHMDANFVLLDLSIS